MSTVSRRDLRALACVVLLAIATTLIPLAPPARAEDFSGSVDADGAKYQRFPLAVAGAGLVTVDLTWEGAADLQLYVDGASGNVGYATSAANPETVEFYAAGPGSYDLVVEAATGAADFDLSTSVDEDALPAQVLRGSVGGSAGEWHKQTLSVPTAGLVTAQLRWNGPAATDLDFYLDAATGNVGYAETPSNPEVIRFYADAPGDYTLIVHAAAGEAQYRAIASVDATARPTTVLRGRVDAAGSAWSTQPLEVASAGLVTARVEWTQPPAGNLDLYVKDAGGATVGYSQTQLAGEIVQFYAPAAGTYSVIVGARSGVGDFRLLADVDAAVPASTVEYGSLDAAGQQWGSYPFEVTQAGTIRAELAWGGPADLNVYLKKDGQSVDFSQTAGNPEVVEYDAEPGSYEVVVGAASGAADYRLLLTVPQDAPVEPCAPYSSLTCDEVLVDGVDLDFSAAAGGLGDAQGEGTGFTMVQPSTTGEYLPDLLDLDTAASALRITTTNGIQFKTPTTTTNGNSLDNGLGVGLDTAGRTTTLTTTVVNPSAAGNTSQQAGLWFGPDQDNYVKLVVAATGANSQRIQLLREVGGVSNAADGDEINNPGTGGVNRTQQRVHLTLVADAATNQVRGSFRIDDSTTETPIGPMTVPASFFNGTLVTGGPDELNGFGGIFATRRNNATAGAVVYTFDGFSAEVSGDEPPANTPPSVTPVADATVTEGEAIAPIQVTATDPDAGDTLTYAAAGLPGGLAIDGATGAITGTPAAGTARTEPYPVTVTVTDEADATATDEFLVTVEPADAPVEPCAPYSSLTCDEVLVDGVDLDFSAAAGGLGDAQGEGTGFTMVQPSTTGEYLPDLLDLDTAASALRITTTNGIQFKTPTTTTNGNSLDNGLGVGLDTAGRTTTLTTTVVNPSAAGNTSQQAGLWFGPDQDNYVKLVVAATGANSQRIQLLREVGGVSNAADGDEINNPGTGGVNRTQQRVHLTLVADAATNQVRGSFRIDDSTTETPIGPLTVPASFFDGTLVSGSPAELNGFGGIFATRRLNTAAGDVVYTFDGFSAALSGAAEQRPRITAVRPANGATGVDVDEGVGADVFLPTSEAGVDEATLTPDTVRLVKVSDGTAVAATRGTSGGNDVITLAPTAPLVPNTQYRFEVTDGVKDEAGAAFVPFSSTFTTGAGDVGPPPDLSEVAFEQVALPTAAGTQYTTLVMGPDDKLYAATNNGKIARFPVNPDGTLGTPQVIESLQTANGGNRLLIGMVFDPSATAANPVLWVTHTTFGFSNVTEEWGGKITRMSGANLETVQDWVVGLPRSAKDHVTNGIVIRDGKLYVNQGSNQAAGAPDTAWGDRGEQLLTATVLEIDPAAIASPPLNVQTADGGTYDPFAPGAPVRPFATGVRNAYDLVWHSNGELYVPTNGTAAGGNSPGTPATLPASCADRIDDAANGDYTGPQVPAANNHPTQRDFLFRVEAGGYYGHPNPLRCEWVLNGGNPTAGLDPGEAAADTNRYPVGTLPDRNYRGAAYDFGFNKSPNGVIEYQSDTFGGALAGQLLVVRYSNSNDILVMDPRAAGGDIPQADGATEGLPGMGGFNDPLDLVEDTDNGNVYVSQYAQSSPSQARITLLRPVGEPAGDAGNAEVGPARVVATDVAGGPAGPTEVVTVRNTGTGPLQVTGLTLGGADAGQFALSGAPALPATVPVGGQVTVTVGFNPTTAGPKGATLTVASDDPDAASIVVPLRGLGAQGLGGAQEPSLQWILDTLQVPIATGDPDPSNNVMPITPLLGDEVAAQTFERAGAGPVTVENLAVFGPTSTNPIVRFGHKAPGAGAPVTELFTVSNSPASNGQRLLPPTTGTFSFDPGTSPFAIASQWPFFSNRWVYGEDALNTWDTRNAHHVRVYPLPGEANAYVVATEEHTSGDDFQDVVVILRNVRPAGSPPPPPPVEGQIDFGPATAALAPGYARDSGMAYSDTRGYGWVQPGTATGVNVTNNMRARTVPSDALRQTLVIMQNDVVTTLVDGSWEHEVPDGTYEVTVNAGDSGFYDSVHSLDVEGTRAIDGFVPSAADPFRQATVDVTVTDGRLTLDAVGSNTKLTHVTFTRTGDVGADDVAPTVEVAVDGSQDPDGNYLNTATVTITAADDGGSGLDAVEYQLDGGAFQPYTAPFAVNADGDHTVVARATDGAGNVTTSPPTTFTVEVPPPSAAEIAVENLDWPQPVPAGLRNDWMVFSRLNSIPSGGLHKVHDTATLRIRNTNGTDPLVITGLAISDTTEFALPGGEADQLPITVAPNAFRDVQVKFVETTGSKGVRARTLTITTNDADEPTTVVQLRGAWMPGPEGGNELTLTQFAQVMGYSTTIGEPLQEEPTTPLAGDEVRSKLWRRADTTKPVYIRQLAAYHGCCTAGDEFAIVGTGGGSFRHNPEFGQSMLPPQQGSATVPAARTFSPTGDFAIRIAGYSTNTTGNLGVRLWPVEIDGQVVPGSFYVAQDFVQNGCGAGSANCDYQDNVYLVTNLAPVAPTDTTAPAAPAGLTAEGSEGGIALDWADNTEPDLAGYHVERSATAGGTFTRLTSSPIAASAYTDAAAPGGATSFYRVLAVDASGNASAPATASAERPGTPPPPAEPVRINTGGPAVTVNGVAYGADQAFSGGKSYSNPQVTGIAGTTDDAIYLNERSATANLGSFSYAVPLPQAGTYTVRLHFAELYHGAPGGGPGGAGKRVMSANLEGGAVELANFDIFAEAGAAATAVVKQYTLDVTDGTLNIAFGATVNQPSVGAIEIIPGAAPPPPGPTPADPVAFSYTGIAAQPFGVSEAQGEVVDGLLYTFGGFDSTKSCCTPTSRSYVHDPAANTWTPIAPLPSFEAATTFGGVTHAGMATDGTDIFVVCGYTANAAGTGQIFGTTWGYRYDVGDDAYVRLPDLPVARAAGQLEYLDGKLHYVGGTNKARTQDVGDHYVLDIAGGATSWTTAAAVPNPRHHAGSAVLDGALYLVGGQHGHDGALTTQADVHRYDPAGNTWTAVADLPRARGHVSNSTFVLDGRIVVAGGEIAHSRAVGDVSVYDPAADEWAPGTGLPANRVSGVAGAIGDGFVFTGGGGSAGGWRATPVAAGATATPVAFTSASAERRLFCSLSAPVEA